MDFAGGQGYWQSAIAAKPSAAHTGYLMGGLMWFCIPFTLATTMGLAALALDLPITVAEAGEGAPYSPGPSKVLRAQYLKYNRFGHMTCKAGFCADRQLENLFEAVLQVSCPPPLRCS